MKRTTVNLASAMISVVIIYLAIKNIWEKLDISILKLNEFGIIILIFIILCFIGVMGLLYDIIRFILFRLADIRYDSWEFEIERDLLNKIKKRVRVKKKIDDNKIVSEMDIGDEINILIKKGLRR